MSFISSQLANSTREILSPTQVRFSKNAGSNSDPLRSIPLTVSDGRDASVLQDRMALTNSRSDLSSPKRGRMLCGRASVAVLAPIDLKWRVLRLSCLERNVARLETFSRTSQIVESEVRFFQRPHE